MIRIFIFIFITIFLYNCSDNLPKKTKESKLNQSDSLTQVIDSIRLANLHKNFIGIHNHGLPTGKKDLAEHAHQNPAQKRRWRKKQFSGMKAKKEAIQRINREKALLRGDSTYFQK